MLDVGLSLFSFFDLRLNNNKKSGGELSKEKRKEKREEEKEQYSAGMG